MDARENERIAMSTCLHQACYTTKALNRRRRRNVYTTSDQAFRLQHLLLDSGICRPVGYVGLCGSRPE